MNKNLLLALALAGAPLAAMAQDAAAPPAVTDSGLANPTSGCKKPDIPDRDAVGSGDDVAVQDASLIKKSPKKAPPVSDFQKDFDAYRACVIAYVSTQNTLAKKHNDAANGAVNELNEFVAEANAAHKKK